MNVEIPVTGDIVKNVISEYLLRSVASQTIKSVIEGIEQALYVTQWGEEDKMLIRGTLEGLKNTFRATQEAEKALYGGTCSDLGEEEVSQ